MYTKEYRKGYLNGIKRILELIKHLDEDGFIHLNLNNSFIYAPFVTFEHVIQPIKDLYDGLSQSDN